MGSNKEVWLPTDEEGNTTTVTHDYTVQDVTDPTVTITTPPDGATYARGQVVNASYSCADEPGGRERVWW